MPGELPPLLRLLGAGAVVANADGDIRRSGQPPPARSARVLAEQGLGRPDRRYGPTRRLLQPVGDIGPAVALPEVRRYDVASPRRIVRVERAGAPTVVDGSADALVGLAAFGALPARGAIVYAGDRSAERLRRDAREGSEVVVSDSNRRRVFVSSRLEQNVGWTLAAGEKPSEDAAMLNPFGGRGTAGQTVAVYRGVRSIHAPFSPGGEQFPEHRPYAAFDGDPRTAWLADRSPRARPSPPRRRVRSPPRRAVRRRAARERPLRGGARDRGRRADVPGPLRLEPASAGPARRALAAAAHRQGRLPSRGLRGGRGRPGRGAGPGPAGQRDAAPAGARRARARGPRRAPQRAHLPVRAHHGRRPLPAGPVHGPAAGPAHHRPRRRGDRPRARASPARGPRVRGRRLGRRHRPTPTTTRSTRSPGPGARRACIRRAASRGSRAGGPRARSTATGARPGSASGWSAPRRGSPGRRRGRCASAACAWRPRPRSCAFRRGCASSPRAATAGRCASGPGAS